MQVHFHIFAKDLDSTKQPGDDSLIGVYTGTLKEPSSLTTPSIAFDMPEVPQANYFYIPEFQRYYYCEGWDWNRGMWIASMRVDVLASYKTFIGMSTQYVLRTSDARYTNGTIRDDYYPLIARPEIHYEYVLPETRWLYGSTYIVGIQNHDTNAVGAVSYYAFSEHGFRAFMRYLMSDSFRIDKMSVPEMSDQLVKGLMNPLQFIASVVWLPYEYVNPEQEQLREVSVGFWSFLHYCVPIADMSSLSLTLRSGWQTFPRHPQETRGYYLRNAPYTNYHIIFPPIGNFDLDPNLCYDSSSYELRLKIDIVTGAAILRIVGQKADDEYSIAEHTVQVGVPIQISQVMYGVGAAVSDVAGAVGSIFELDAGGFLSGAISSAADIIRPSVTTIGTNGALGLYIGEGGFAFQAEFYPVADEGRNLIGKPCCRELVVGNIDGYLMTKNARLELPIPSDELQLITQSLDSGIHYE